MLTAAQLKAARALVGMEQRALAEASGVSLPTIQRMEASNGNVRGVVDTLMKVMSALEAAGIEFIHEGTVSHGGGRGIRLRGSRGAEALGSRPAVQGRDSNRRLTRGGASGAPASRARGG